MHEFKYKGRYLYCENVKIADLLSRFDTPLYIYSYKTLIDHFFKLNSAFKSIDPLICFSVKANSNLAILKSLVDKGAGLDIVSGGELFRALKAGCPAGRIVYASVGKTDKEITRAVRKKILFFNVESLSELNSLNRIAKREKKSVNVAIRINPDIEPKTHRYITTGKLTNKFGIDLRSAEKILTECFQFSNLKIKGLHIHIGSQITESAPFVSAISKIINFIDRLKSKNINLEYLNIGGGLGIVYNNERPQTAKRFAKDIIPLLRRTGLKVILEPGRFVVGNAGILVTKVLYIKNTPIKKFVIVDAGMNDLIRPALYEAYHTILPVVKPKNPAGRLKNQKFDVVGPICESGDFFAKDRRISYVREGGFLAIMSSGAYGFSMSSNYNSRPRAAEVMVVNNNVFTIRKRETYIDLIDNEVIPNFLLGY
jgi:diaminopimelate decarboxylase